MACAEYCLADLVRSSWLGAIVASEKILGIVPEGTHSWDKFINEAELREYFKGLRNEKGESWATDIKSLQCIYNPLRGEWQFGQGVGNTAFNYFIAARKSV
jgi:polyprenyldihydroxybenzoate methyltransferase / 3-demethylubiquinol 3-O-methyltransferase